MSGSRSGPDCRDSPSLVAGSPAAPSAKERKEAVLFAGRVSESPADRSRAKLSEPHGTEAKSAAARDEPVVQAMHLLLRLSELRGKFNLNERRLEIRDPLKSADGLATACYVQSNIF